MGPGARTQPDARMMKLAAFLALPLLAAVTANVPPAPAEPDTEVRTIIRKAVERADWAREQDFSSQYRQVMTQRALRFNGDDEVTEDETLGYAIEPYEGVPYAKLVRKNGEAIAGQDLKEEAKRWEQFLETLEDPPEPDEDDTNIIFNADLLDRYTATLTGIREVRGRPAFVLAFEPKPGDLPARRRIDHALNKSRGEIWIDQETYEIARITFELMERVRLWGGILGSVSQARGNFERTRVGGDAWLASEVDMYFQLRVLFRTSRRREITHWSQFEPLGDQS